MLKFLTYWLIVPQLALAMIPDVKLEIDFSTSSKDTQSFWFPWTKDDRVIYSESKVFLNAFHHYPIRIKLNSSCGLNFVKRERDQGAYFHKLLMDGLRACEKISVELDGLPKGDYSIAFPLYDQLQKLDSSIEIIEVRDDVERDTIITSNIENKVPLGPLALKQGFFSVNDNEKVEFAINSSDGLIFLNGLVITLYKDTKSCNHFHIVNQETGNCLHYDKSDHVGEGFEIFHDKCDRANSINTWFLGKFKNFASKGSNICLSGGQTFTTSHGYNNIYARECDFSEGQKFYIYDEGSGAKIINFESHICMTASNTIKTKLGKSQVFQDDCNENDLEQQFTLVEACG